MPMDNAVDTEHNDRSKMYKNSGKPDDLRRRRVETSVELRRQKRSDDLMKRRNINLEQDSEESDAQESIGESTKNKTPVRITPEEARNILLNNPSLEQMQFAFEQIRRLLSINNNPPVDDIINAGLVEALVKALEVQDRKVQFEAAWGLTNIVSGTSDQTLIGVRAGCVKPLVPLMFSDDIPLAEQAMWAIANIAGDSAQLRDHVIQNGVIPALDCLMSKLEKLPKITQRTLAWTYSNLCRHKNPSPSVEVLRLLAPGLAKLISVDDEQVRIDSCWALSYLTDGPDENLEVALKAGVIPYVVDLISSSAKDQLAVPALRTLGNFATGSDLMTQVVVDSGILREVIPRIIKTRSNSLIKESCWLVSNVIAGTQAQIQASIDAKLVTLMLDGDAKSQFEASWAVANLVHGGTIPQVCTLYKANGLAVMCDLLKSKNVEVLCNMLDSIKAVLFALQAISGDKLENAKEQIEECGGLDSLEALQQHENSRIYETALGIIENFFSNDETDEEKENGIAGGDTNMQFNF
uniref:Importin subunit alpha n=1 Tax=Acrobeloides nanus TaxID=290746 RepID=A0A914CPX9_9BILA